MAGPNWPNLGTSQDRGRWTTSSSLSLAIVLLLFHTVIMWSFLLMKALLCQQIVDGRSPRSVGGDVENPSPGCLKIGRRKSKEGQMASDFNVYMNDLTLELADLESITNTHDQKSTDIINTTNGDTIDLAS